jgi:DNA polymerase-3 subunit delta'
LVGGPGADTGPDGRAAGCGSDTGSTLSLSRIIGQDHALSLLRAAFASGRPSHAYLFHGPEGVGKETTALELAASMNCEGGDLAGCGECRACVMAAGLSHPDIHLIFPTPSDMKPSDLGEVIGKYVREGYRDQDFGRKLAIISVEAVLSEVVAKANQRPYLGPWKVFILADADMMTVEAANTLLKTLEEPPPMTVIILTTSRLSALPVTVVSRCQKIQFARLSREAVERILLADPRLGMSEGDARAAAALSRGSAGRAARMESRSFEAELDSVAAIMTGKRAGDIGSLLDEAEKLAFRLGRNDQQRVLDLMLLWFRDVLLLANLGDQEARAGVLYARHVEALERQARVMDVSVTEPLIRKIDDARRAIERYSNPTIVFTSVLLDIAIARKRATTGGKASYAA